jgi:hypothetical protein
MLDGGGGELGVEFVLNVESPTFRLIISLKRAVEDGEASLPPPPPDSLAIDISLTELLIGVECCIESALAPWDVADVGGVPVGISGL